MKRKILLILAIAVITTVSITYKSKPKDVKNVFQPDAQMLTQSLLSTEDPHIDTEPHDDEQVHAAEDVGAGEGSYKYVEGICQDESVKYFNCFKAHYSHLVGHFGIDAAFDDIKKRFKEDIRVETNCHPLVHVIGQEASLKYKTVSEAYLHGDSFCWSGYYHGILEGFIGRIGNENLAREINNICADIPGRDTYNFNYYNCVHGVGHGIMEVGQNEVFESLAMCDNLTGSWERESCYSGVFMENIIADGKNHTTKFLKPEEPLYPCTALEAKYKYQCYLGQTSYALGVTGYDFKKVFDMCTTVEQPFRDVCNQSMGRDAANQAMHKAEGTKTTCYLVTSTDDRANCIIGAAKEFVSNFHSDVEAKEFCSVLLEPGKTTCYDTTRDYYTVF
jgi:hypothetical protein